MSYLGSWKIDDLLTFTAQTQVFATGIATDADSAPSYRVYEDETGTPIVTGTMATLDASNTDGFYSEQITLSAANGFEKGKSYNIRIAATVSGVAGATIRNFQIEAEVDANRVNWANVDNPTTTVGLSGTTVKTATDVETDTQDIQSRLPAALVSGRMDSSTGAMAANTLTASALASDAVTEIQSGLSTLDAAGVRSAVGLASANLDTQLDALPTATENADALLNRDMSAVTVTNARSPINALRFLRNRWVNAAGNLTVYKEDDSTTAWTGTTTTGSSPIASIDPS